MLGKNILSFLETEAVTPKPYGVYHIAWLIATIFVIGILVSLRKKHSEKKLKVVLGIYGFGALILEALKQLIWAVEYDNVVNKFIWDYQWYAAPFQLCTMPIYVSLICLFMKKCKVRDALLSFIAYVTILGSIASAIIPDALFVSDILINIHAMFLHLGSLVVSIYLIVSGEVKSNIKSYVYSITVFLIAIIAANTLNILVYNSGVLNGETFNMFYISPYFESTLPVFDTIYELVPYPLFLIIYFVSLSIGALIIYLLSRIKFKVANKK